MLTDCPVWQSIEDPFLFNTCSVSAVRRPPPAPPPPADPEDEYHDWTSRRDVDDVVLSMRKGRP